jgi:putative ABC transport system substrate-binding protein
MKTHRGLVVAVLALVVLAACLPGHAQEPGKVWRIGFLSPYSPTQDKARYTALQRGLRDLGYVEGKNFVIEQRSALGRFDRLATLAAELVHSPVDLLIVHGDAAVAAKQATSTIPIVMIANPDPVGMGLAASLGHPGSNVTGLSDLHTELVGKRLALLKEALPSTSRIGVVLDSRVPAHPPQLKDVQAAAHAMPIAVVPIDIHGPPDFDLVLAMVKRERLDALNVLGGAAGARRRQFAELAMRHKIPAISTTREFAEDGLLMTYGSDFPDLYRRAATYVDRIVKGARPADLPIEQPTKFELTINLRTAKALGLTLPQALLLRADQVIE